MKVYLFAIFRKLVRTLSGRGLGLTKIPGVDPAYKKLYGLLRPKDIVLVEVQGSKMYVKPDDSGISAAIINQGVWEPQETALFYALIKPRMTVLDVGANMGYYTLIAAKLVGSAGRAYAFEPDPENCQLIVKSVQLNGYNNVSVFNNAVGDRRGRVKLHLESTNWGHSLSPRNINNPAGSIEVELITLDDLYQAGKLGDHIHFIKLDVQGAEELVLKGARMIIQEQRPVAVMELEPARLNNMGSDALNLLHWFEHEGYSIRVIEKDIDVPKSATPEMITFAAEKMGVLNVLLTPRTQ